MGKLTTRQSMGADMEWGIWELQLLKSDSGALFKKQEMVLIRQNCYRIQAIIKFLSRALKGNGSFKVK